MIKWSSKPDPVFYDIISNALEVYQDSLKEELFDDDDIAFKTFGQKGLVIELEKIITAHKSKKTFTITDFHFLILYDALIQFCELYNDDFFGKFSFGGIQPSQLDFELMVGIYFFDTDFLLDQEIINNLSVDQKNVMAISSDNFSIANNLKPHADELKILETDDIDLEAEDEILYKDGESYPYLDGIDED